MFKKLKEVYNDYMEEREFAKNINEDIKARDKAYKQHAKLKAREEFMKEREELLEYRKQQILAKERYKYNKQRDRLEDTTPKSVKIKKTFKKVGKDLKKWSSKVPDISEKIGRNTKNNLGLGNKKSISIEDRIKRNL